MHLSNTKILLIETKILRLKTTRNSTFMLTIIINIEVVKTKPSFFSCLSYVYLIQ